MTALVSLCCDAPITNQLDDYGWCTACEKHCQAVPQPSAAVAESAAPTAAEIREAALKILEGFDRGVFVRNTAKDHESDWAIKAFPYLRALAVLARLLPDDESPAESRARRSDAMDERYEQLGDEPGRY